MDPNKKSIVNYDDDDVDDDDDERDRKKYHDDHGTKSSRYDRRDRNESNRSMSSKTDYRDRRRHGHSNNDDPRSKTRYSHRSARDDSSSYRRRSSPNHREWRIRSNRDSRSRSRERESHHRHRHHRESPSRNDSNSSRSRKHSNCRKSKRDKSHDRATESHSHRYRNASQERERAKTSRLKEKVEKIEPPPPSPPQLPPQPPPLSSSLEPNPQPINRNEPVVSLPIFPMANKPNIPITVLKPTVPTTQEIPKYYNSNVVNTSKIAAQEEKRKLLWGDTKKEKASTIWANLKFQGKHGSAMTEKFRKLMGIKSNEMEQRKDENVESSSDCNAVDSGVTSKQAELFENLNIQYSIARMSTHVNRGVGLGFRSSSSSANRIP